MNGSESKPEFCKTKEKTMLRQSLRLVVLPLILTAGIVLQPHAALWGSPPLPPAAPPPSPPERLEVRPPKGPPPSPAERVKPSREITRLMWGKDSSFVFAGHAGDVITLRVNSKNPGLDPHVCLVDPKHGIEAFDDDSGGHGNSLIGNHALKRNGLYTIIVGLDNKAQGEVEILLTREASRADASRPGPAMVASPSRLSCGAKPRH